MKLGSRSACACVEAGFSIQNGDLLEECSTEEQRSVVRFFLWAEDSVKMMFVKKCFLFTMGNVCRVKRFTTESRNSLKDVRKSQTIKRRCRSG
jgi:hypothetical protein